jgi:hypothetical protein
MLVKTNNANSTYGCVYTATVVTRSRHNITLHVHCLSCSFMSRITRAVTEYVDKISVACDHEFIVHSGIHYFHRHVHIFIKWRNSSFSGAYASTFSRLHDHTLDTPQSVGLLWTSDQPVAETSTWQHTTLTTDRHPCPRQDSNPQSQ